tara:strand:- start:200 stop:664 length:465 start_codon:yes stop_codon:yes gene_type:complete
MAGRANTRPDISVVSNFHLESMPKKAILSLVKGEELASIKFEFGGELHEYVLRKKQVSDGKTRKIVINNDFGGFSLPKDAMNRLRELTGNPEASWIDYAYKRDDPFLVQVVEEMVQATRDQFTLSVVEIPANVDWAIHGYDGMEHVYEKHRRWY